MDQPAKLTDLLQRAVNNDQDRSGYWRGDAWPTTCPYMIGVGQRFTGSIRRSSLPPDLTTQAN